MPNIGKFLRLLFIYLIGKPIAYPVRRKLYRFDDATHDPEQVQQTVLRGLLAYHANTDFGREHGLAHIQNVADFRRQLPIAGYDYVEPWIARVRRGETNALLADRKIHMFALTSGRTATRKFIPVTDRYLACFSTWASGKPGQMAFGVSSILSPAPFSCFVPRLRPTTFLRKICNQRECTWIGKESSHLVPSTTRWRKLLLDRCPAQV